MASNIPISLQQFFSIDFDGIPLFNFPTVQKYNKKPNPVAKFRPDARNER